MDHQRDLIELGRGNCGSVWAQPIADDENTGNNDYTVIKRGDGSEHRSVTKEHDIHKHIAHAAATTASASKTNLITGYQVNIVTPVEIPPMQRPVRHLLAQTCYGTGAGGGTQDPKLAACLLDAETNEQNCLVRPFLGRRRYQPQQDASACPERPRLVFVTLRNIPLHLDQMEELGLWERFMNRYSQTGEEILERKGQDQRVKKLPGKVMEMIENTRGRWSKSVV
ncbi:hypothetical protein QBC32DRAFT_317312 [Pseudoneurospora amorphoporcata]|uniref:Uncharacterized protein n=1 Tax=Pseudoneurospora amorphoporcata TaxID=241081 RepID=A0AAN6NN67_9PEZI|nr:hypothetical protein QBC32DRAFT_317312 [Pseudoneurospora amorphoporcata]